MNGRRRVVIHAVRPEIDGGRFPIKRTLGERVVVEASAFADGHDQVTCMLRYRHESEPTWREIPMTALPGDRWRGEFRVQRLGRYLYTLQAWVDDFGTWQRDLARRAAAGQDVSLELRVGAQLLHAAAQKAPADAAAALRGAAAELTTPVALAGDLTLEMARYPDREFATLYDLELAVTVEGERAGSGAWYELFPRSCSPEPGRHGTLRDCADRLAYVAGMGFDVVYLPPIHPIGRTCRKGRNNLAQCGPDDVGSPWAVGSAAGGHTGIHPDLGTLADFAHLIETARGLGLEVALDLAFQCSPDHPWVQQHPHWFRHLPDGSIRHAENPPKQYQDIYPLALDSEHWDEIWAELKQVVRFWLRQGVHIFRVDNPHTKPFAFWEWLIRAVQTEYPDVIFLAEAFTRPAVMYRLAKAGFSQSYTYFSWRNTCAELQAYLRELHDTEVREYFRPSFWTNTPDILPEHLQQGGRPTAIARLVLAATLVGNYGIYGPAFELLDNQPLAPGQEEYLNSEKYQIRHWDLDRPGSLVALIACVNRIRRANPALSGEWRLAFHEADNDQFIAYSRRSPDGENVILVIVNLDPRYTQSGWVTLSLAELGVTADDLFQAHDLLSDARYLWQGARTYVELDPHVMPAHIFRIQRRARSEQNFTYFS